MTQPTDRYSPLGLASLALDNAKLLIGVPLAALVLAVAFTVLLRGQYVAGSSFTPQAKESEAARLAGLASQFGVNLAGLGQDDESVDFYARLAHSRALLEPVALAEYRFAKKEGSADTIQGTLVELLKVKGDTPAELRLEAVKALRKRVNVGLDLKANVVTVTTKLKWAALAEQVNRALLDEINRFNLERRQTRAAAERRFAQQQSAQAQAELEKAEGELGTFLQHNRRYEDWPQLRFEAAQLQRRVDLRQQLYTTLAQRLEQARVDEVRNTPVITIIDAPEGSAEREGSVVRNGILAMILGFALVIAFLFVREYRERLRAQDPEAYRRIQERTRALLPRRGNGVHAGGPPLVFLLLGLGALAGCGDALTAPEAPPVFTRITTRGDHSCAVTESGAAYCWGRGTDGELGNGAEFNTAVPVQVAGEQKWTEITAGDTHTCALAENGRAWCWGWNAYYQRGNAFDPANSVPVPVSGERAYTAISAGAHHTCALTAEGEVYCWGYNRYGQIGDATTNTAYEPMATATSRRFKAVSAGAWHTCAIGTDDLAYCWGRNDQAQLGTGLDAPQISTPTPVAGSERFVFISAGTNHTCALSGAQAYCWGGNEHGQLGDGSTQRAGIAGAVQPARTATGYSFDAISAGSYVTCGIAYPERAMCWGRGRYGQVGSGEASDYNRPQWVELHAKGQLRFHRVAATGATHVCAISTADALYCWGTGAAGQLGTTKLSFTAVPQRVRAAAEGIR